MFELRRLRLLHELALRGTLAAVAGALSYSPSTISQQLALLEREAGVALLAPDGRRVRLTEHGAALAAHAARALDADEQIRAELERLQPGIAPVRVAVLQTAARTIVPAALTLLAQRAPALRVELSEVPPEEGLFELSARGFDLAIAEQYPGLTRAHRPDLERHVLGVDPMRLATAHGGGLRDGNAGRDSRARRAPRAPEALAALEALAGHPWVMEPAGTAARDWAVQQCRAAGFEPDVRFELADLGAHVALIAAGRAVGMLPDLLWTDSPAPVTLGPLPGDPAREIFTATRRASAGRPGIRLVQDAISEAFAAARA